jgi:hypothetical protein
MEKFTWHQINYKFKLISATLHYLATKLGYSKQQPIWAGLNEHLYVALQIYN